MGVVQFDFGQSGDEQLKAKSAVGPDRHPEETAGPAVEFAYDVDGVVDGQLVAKIVGLGIGHSGVRCEIEPQVEANEAPLIEAAPPARFAVGIIS